MQNRLIWRIAIDKRLAHNMLNNPEKSIPCINIYYLHQEVVFTSVCLSFNLSVCLLPQYLKKYLTDFHVSLWKVWP